MERKLVAILAADVVGYPNVSRSIRKHLGPEHITVTLREIDRYAY